MPSHAADAAAMPMSSEPVERGRLVDVQVLVEWVVAAAAEGHFSPSYRQLKHQMGLLLQLCGAVLLKRWRVSPHDTWRFAQLWVVRQDGVPVAFALVRHLGGPHRELHLLCVAPHMRRQGLARRLLAHTLAQASAQGHVLWVVTAHRQRPMHRLLTQAGAMAQGSVGISGATHARRESVSAFSWGVPASTPLPDGLWVQ